jgi:hypothetical protein
MNRKGVVTDVLTLVVMFFILVVTVFSVSLISHEFNNAIQNETGISDTAKDAYERYDSKLTPNLNSGMLLTIIIMHLAIIFLSIQLPSHPSLFPLLFIGLVVVLLLSAYISNTYDELATSQDFLSITEEYTYVDWIMRHFVMINLVLGSLDILAFLAIGAWLNEGGGL